jgi:hypothetical protein
MSSPAPTEIAVQASARCNQLRERQAITIALLFTGNAAYYFCRSDLSVAMPLLIEKLHRHGMSTDDAVSKLGSISSFGGLAAFGKLFLTGMQDTGGEPPRRSRTSIAGEVEICRMFRPNMLFSASETADGMRLTLSLYKDWRELGLPEQERAGENSNWFDF